MTYFRHGVSYLYWSVVSRFDQCKKFIVSMLLFKLKLMEGTLEKDGPEYAEQLETIIKLEKLLLEVSLEDEEMPEHSFDKALLLLNDINGERLTRKEEQLLYKLIYGNNN